MQGKVDITTVGGRIKYLRTQAELSQDELAELLNLENRASVSSYETNRRAVSGELAVELAKVLGSSVNYILRGEEEPENPIENEIFRLVKSVCPAAHCGRRYPQIIFGGFLSPIVRHKLRLQAISGTTADCRSLISRVQKLVLLK